jgi:two-component system cell cycle response regulator DivK
MNLPSSAAWQPPAGHLVLLVDRDHDTRRMYAEFLKLGAWRVDESADGREALAKAIATPPDVVVTETRLPGISGYDLCDLLRRDVTTSRIPIVVVTADVYAMDVNHARSAGADIVLTKPCPPERLQAELSRIIASSGMSRQRGGAVPGEVADQLARAEDALGRSRETLPRHSLKRAHHRGDTIDPPTPPPTLLCPACDRSLAYQRSHVGGVSSKYAEQWDYYDCASGCGTFQYRTRTRKLRKVA